MYTFVPVTIIFLPVFGATLGCFVDETSLFSVGAAVLLNALALLRATPVLHLVKVVAVLAIFGTLLDELVFTVIIDYIFCKIVKT